jgi:hypothetical protein
MANAEKEGQGRGSGCYRGWNAYLPRLIRWVFVDYFVYILLDDIVPLAIDIDISKGALMDSKASLN